MLHGSHTHIHITKEGKGGHQELGGNDQWEITSQWVLISPASLVSTRDLLYNTEPTVNNNMFHNLKGNCMHYVYVFALLYMYIVFLSLYSK
jgi:hypothetical protein